MSLLFAVPIAVAIFIAVFVGVLKPGNFPRMTTVIFTVLSMAVAGAWLLASSVLALQYLAQHTALKNSALWCEFLASHHIPHWLGISSLIASVFSITYLLRNVIESRRIDQVHFDSEFVVIPTVEPIACALPGHPGTVVVSAGMLRRLDAQGRRILLAHERSHLENQHHRYVRLTTAAAAVLPVLRPLLYAVRFTAEAWADDAAVRAVGSRKAVADVIAHIALCGRGATLAGSLGMAEGDVTARVQRLMRPAKASPFRAGLSARVASLVTAGVAASVLQMEQLVQLISHVCAL